MATWRQMERLVDMGLVKEIGMSNMTIPKLEAVLPLCRIKPAMCEMEYESNINSTCDGDPLTDEEMAKIATLEKNNRLVKGQVFLWEGATDWHDLWDGDGVIVDCPDAK